MKAKTNMEGKYVKKMAEVSVAQTQKRCDLSEQDSRKEIEVHVLLPRLINQKHEKIFCFLCT